MDDSTIEHVRAWSYRRQLLDRAAPDVLSALQSVVGVYSTHPTAPLSLLARANGVADELPRLERAREVVRIPAMRGSTFLVARKDAPYVLAATRQNQGKLEQRLRYGGLDLDVYRKLTPAVLRCTGEPRLPREIAACVGDPAAVLVSRVLAREGLILRINSSLRVDQLRYVAADAWLGQPFDSLESQDALSWLAREYFKAFGPARVADFAWWSGATRREAARAVAALGLKEVADDLAVLEQDVPAFANVAPLGRDAIAVLPKWDAYTMAYAPDGRRRLIKDEHLKLAYTSREGSPGATAGDGLAVVLHAGRAVATWSHRFTGRHMQIEVQQFPGERIDEPVLVQRFQAAGQLMGANVEVTVVER